MTMRDASGKFGAPLLLAADAPDLWSGGQNWGLAFTL